MIRRIRALARGIRKSEPVTASLTPGELSALRELASMPAWRTYQSLLELLVEHNAEGLLTTQSTEALHYLRGLIVGLRESTLYVERMIAQEADARTQRSTTDASGASGASGSRRRGALFATPGWSGGSA